MSRSSAQSPTQSIASYLVIIADDLTGAADSAARARQAGLAAWVLLEDAAWPERLQTPAAVALSTDSRHLAPEEAAARVTASLAWLPALPAVRWYKKIDSTLRGHIGAEVDAMLAWLGEGAVAVICPAFPAQRRGLADGYLVHADTPPRSVHLPTLLRGQSRHAVAAVDLATVEAGRDRLEAALVAAQQEGARLVVVDALEERHLETIAAAAQGALAAPLLCGSAGLVGVLSSQLAGATPAAVSAPWPAGGPVLGVVGSGSPMAHRQIEQVARRGDVRVRSLDRTWSTVDVVSPGTQPAGNWLLHLEPPPAGLSLEGPLARAEAARLADLTQVMVQRMHPASLIVVGGDTATYVLRVLGIRRLEVIEELLPGIPLTVGEDSRGDPRAVVLKPGNFGDDGTLAALYDRLAQPSEVRLRTI
ncbi:MAG: hypothetical protein DCC57_16765 [Chloroflexi bacterium]|nr:MAG: hypothetical protein DCC57_16765 [Chloroflexota bacterium]